MEYKVEYEWLSKSPLQIQFPIFTNYDSIFTFCP